MISEDLLRRLLEAFPENAKEIKEHIKKDEKYELIKLLLEVSGITKNNFKKEISALKAGEVDLARNAAKKRKRLYALVLEVISAI